MILFREIIVIVIVKSIKSRVADRDFGFKLAVLSAVAEPAKGHSE